MLHQFIIRFTFFSLCVLYSNPAITQVPIQGSSLNKNMISIGFGGHTLGYALNFERFLINNPQFKTSAQVGISYMWKDNFVWEKGVLSNTIRIHQLIKIKTGEFLELGAGILFRNNIIYENQGFKNKAPIFNLSYRFQTDHKKWMAKLSYTPIYDDHNFFHFGGIEIGYRF